MKRAGLLLALTAVTWGRGGAHTMCPNQWLTKPCCMIPSYDVLTVRYVVRAAGARPPDGEHSRAPAVPLQASMARRLHGAQHFVAARNSASTSARAAGLSHDRGPAARAVSRPAPSAT